MDCTFEVADCNMWIVRIDHSVFGTLAEQILGVNHEILIHRRVLRNKEHHRFIATASCAACLLPETGDRPWITHQDAGVQTADIDTEFQRVRTGDAKNLLAYESLLNLPTLLREVSAAIGMYGFRKLPRDRPQQIATILEDQFRRQTCPNKGDRLYSALHQFRHEVDSLPKRTATITPATPLIRLATRSGVNRRRVPHDESFRTARRTVMINQRHRPTGDTLCVLLRIADCSRAANKLHVSPVVAADAVQPTEHIGQVRAENPAVRMHLIDHNIPKVSEKSIPSGMVRKDALVEHVRVGQ